MLHLMDEFRSWTFEYKEILNLKTFNSENLQPTIKVKNIILNCKWQPGAYAHAKF